MVITPIVNDGRINRSKTTLNKIVAATISLLRKNNNGQIPTAQEIAVKSGVGIRTVFRHIDDMEGLIEEVNRRYLNDLESYIAKNNPKQNSKDQRIEHVIKERFYLYNTYQHVFNLTITSLNNSSAIRTGFIKFNNILRQRFEDLIPEIKMINKDKQNLIDTLISYAAWFRMTKFNNTKEERLIEELKLLFLMKLK
tara:strand:- start:122 stop:709 length:588 start_codon:yes stop_codon:yes gene_type:complete